MQRIVGLLCGPRGGVHGEVGTRHDGLTEEGDIFAPGKRHAHSVHLEAMEPIDTELNPVMAAPAAEPVGRSAVEEVMLPCALPDEMPWILWIDAEDAAAMS